MADKIKVSLLGSTGMVGQKMVRMLSKHPYIELVKVSASPQKIGKKYKDAVKWIEPGDIPENVAELPIVSTEYEDHKDVDVVLSALPNELAEDVELKLVKQGKIVVSNASPFRMDPDVPLINPEVNWEHLELLKYQKSSKNWNGLLVKNPNCTAAILSMPIKPLERLIKINATYIVTLQAVSGAGYSGLPFMAIDGNVVPWIKGEEEKIPKEINKMLGKFEAGKLKSSSLEIHPTTTRVPVKVGHMGVINIVTDDNVDEKEVQKALDSFASLPQHKNLPTAPNKPIIVFKDEDRPQPARDLQYYDGMAVTVGRVKFEGNVLRLVVLGDNLVRGAAGITILTLEVMKELGYF
ncbi:aspartate-semialdehyde dehydrogenase [Saccharolobus solfataricus]|uniref:malonyl CoA reductase (malonate semialdehyde-forming) n=3 Tax=Saccharolobus solfataricus TaxID=2287 RepID=Q97ZL8_SACS2|nr:aspartate-semialdehyde dehydrogenase [Saccharolobus solfataricus]AAK41162.1 Aspartate-semialdehyde dehydrogenase (ASA dehydrogenase) (asd-1) [Saccharolobus solfataricus P2]AKA74119.1 aspartate-semialdehyde dehydrogenase [Saccharolobus solfataricus]AKA76817.1 aspartate-semialdehyde dehydrogenase [Saccharolobus solfataricus]AKA79510.1 aspartate-semialdehyde dehydrogenase [Saccharolobus solfataricus]AZF68597.1 aspartate-semialdehyde dehydrogenase [Saccharolobus solfataricus]